jgi:hypothetical protein
MFHSSGEAMSDRLYKLIEAADVFTAPSRDELVARFANKEGWTKNKDGSYYVEDSVIISREADYNVAVDDQEFFAALSPAHLLLNGKLLLRFSRVEGDFLCSDVDLKSLVGCPREVGGNFECDDNPVPSLKGGPEKVHGSFNCSVCALSSLEGAPREVGGDFICFDNSEQFTEEQVREVCNVKGDVYV